MIGKTGKKVRTKIPLRQLELFRVFNPHQVQPIRMSRDPTGSTYTRLQYLLSPLNRALARSDGHQNTGEIAHHVMQKGIGTHVDHDELAML